MNSSTIFNSFVVITIVALYSLPISAFVPARQLNTFHCRSKPVFSTTNAPDVKTSSLFDIGDDSSAENDAVKAPKKKVKKPFRSSNKKHAVKNSSGNGNKKSNGTKNKGNKNRSNTRKKGGKKGKKSTFVKENVPLLPLVDLKLGSRIDGHVAAFTSFGIFIKIPYDLKGKKTGGYALLHKSQIRDEPVNDLSKLFRIGAKVKGLRVIQVNYAKGEVGLSLRDQRAERKELSEIEVGSELTGKVTKVVSYGAFLDVGAKVNALLHISRISQKKITNIREWVNEGDEVTVRITGKDTKKKNLAASMLDVDSDRYLDKRSEQMKKLNSKEASVEEDKTDLKSELEYFEAAVRELEDSLKE